MSLSGIRTLSLLLLAAPGLLACRQNPLVKPANPAPKAVAKATLGPTPGTILLDGSMSTDDGTIAKWHWASGTRRPDGMPGRYIPAGIPTTNWPGDGQMVMVSQLPDGCWIFDLWVTDTLGAVSDPVTTPPIAIGNAMCPSAGGAGGGAAGGSGGAGGGGAGGGGAGGGGAGGGGAGGSMAGAGGQ